MASFIYYMAEDDIKGARGADEDEAFDEFMRLHHETPLRILGVTKDENGVVEGEVVWEEDCDAAGE